jgi:DNA-binding MarR family transcriptional regulator
MSKADKAVTASDDNTACAIVGFIRASLSKYARTHDFTLRQVHVLAAIVAGDSNRNLKMRLNLPGPSICRALDALEHHGLVSRSVDRRDERLTVLSRTAEGNKVVKRISSLATSNAVLAQARKQSGTRQASKPAFTASEQIKAHGRIGKLRGKRSTESIIDSGVQASAVKDTDLQQKETPPPAS